MLNSNERKIDVIVESDRELTEIIENIKRNMKRSCRYKSCCQPFQPNCPLTEKSKGWFVQEKFTDFYKLIYDDETIRLKGKNIKVCRECCFSYKTKIEVENFFI